MRRKLFVTLALSTMTGCGSSQYRPANSPYVSVVRDGLSTVYYKNGRAYGAVRDAVAGDRAAEEEGRTAHVLGDWSAALVWGALGAEIGGFVLIGAGSNDTVSGVGGGLLLVGLGSLIAGMVVNGHAVSHAQDAVTIYNNKVSARRPPAELATTTPSGTEQPSTVAANVPRSESDAVPPRSAPNGPGHRHDGFYLRLTSGLEYVAYSGAGPDGHASMAATGPSSLVAIGGTPFSGVAIAWSLSTNRQTDQLSGAPGGTTRDASASSLVIGLLIDWFPDPGRGWHVGTNLGLGDPRIDYEGSSGMKGAGFTAALLGGYDFWIGPEWSLGILGVASATPPVRLRDDQGNETGYRLKALSFGIQGSLLFH